jgi:hypothetical protein
MAGGIVQHVDGSELDAFSRKKLFRAEAAASTRLDEQNKSISVFHGGSP